MKKSLLALALLSVTGLANANLIQNGSFELPVLPSGTWVGPLAGIPGWTTTAGPGIEVRNNVAGQAEDGNNFVELDSTANSSMSQTITTTAGVLYDLSYWYSPRTQVTQYSNPITATWNGQLLATSTGNGSTNGQNNWVELIFQVVGTGSDTLTFAAGGISDSYGGSLDNVQLTATPLPAAVWLMASGLGFLGFGRRKSI